MKNPSIYITILAGLAVILATAHPLLAQVAQKNEVISLRDGLKDMLQAHGAASLKKLTVTVDAEKASAMKARGVEAEGSYTVYQGLAGDGSTTGHVVVMNEQGKEGPLQMLVAINPEGEVYDIGFTVFGEDKGKSAIGWPFLKQFVSKKTDDAFVLGNDIDGISGATWTSTSVTAAIKRAVVLYDTFF